MGDHGSAISLLIISNEEAIKALVLYFEGFGFRLRNIPGFPNLFDNHRLRYLVSFIIAVSSIIMEDFQNVIMLLFKDPDKLLEFFKLKPSEMTRRFKLYFLRRYVVIYHEIIWYSNIEKHRQKGFYSDSYSDDPSKALIITLKDFDIFYDKNHPVK